MAEAERPDLVVVGPEALLCAGVVDALSSAGFVAFGPTRAAARLEGSKAFMKALATRAGIPTAPFFVTSSFEEACAYVAGRSRPLVVKTDGPAAGKGAIVTATAEEATAAARAMLVDGAFGEAGSRIVLEDRLEGEELSVHAVTDGERMFVLPIARDHKRVGDGDRGGNTGGMGACAPVDVPTELRERIVREVLAPTLSTMRADGTPFRGVLFAGLMVTADGTPFLLEHNVRFGDPETQAILPLLDGDLARLLDSAARGALDLEGIAVAAERAAVAVVLAADGYPRAARRGDALVGVEAAMAIEGAHLVHAGTARAGDGFVTAGGRVLSAVGVASTGREARTRAYAAARAIRFAGMHYRRDVAAGWS